MKKLVVIAFISGTTLMVSCGDGVKREPGRVYMPDMMYSRAYETYSITEEQRKEWEKQGIYFTGAPVPGTVKRGIDYTFHLIKDKPGDSTNYVASKQIKNPVVAMDSVTMKESERLYLVNCGICHGSALDGNGPLYKNGEGPYAAKPANLAGDPKYKYATMPDGQMFYSITYGKNLMGSYASQLNSTQRWQVIAYIRSKQGGGQTVASAAGATVTAGAAKADSTAK
jgi:mono/diheme cytochrome c family protein